MVCITTEFEHKIKSESISEILRRGGHNVTSSGHCNGHGVTEFM